jgi:hypothetical protein
VALAFPAQQAQKEPLQVYIVGAVSNPGVCPWRKDLTRQGPHCGRWRQNAEPKKQWSRFRA